MTRDTCATCNASGAAMIDNKPSDEWGFCHAAPPVIVGENHSASYFPPVNLKRTWCRQWQPKEDP